MPYKMTIVNPQRVFEVEEGETILDAALRQGIQVRYGCRQGKCSTCKHYILDGDFDNSRASAYALLAEEREEGMTLLCQTYPESDCTIELVADPAGEDGIQPPKTHTVAGRISGREQLTPSLWSVRLEFDKPLRYLPGQYLEVGVPGSPGVTRTFSIASAPFDSRRVELVVQRYEGGAFTGQLEDIEGAQVPVSGPYGRMFLRPSGRAVVLIGDGVGIGPLLSIARYAGRQGWAPGMRILQGAPSDEEIACREELTAWADSVPNFAYQSTTEKLAGVLAREIESGLSADVYIAGDGPFCDQALFLLEARGIDAGHIYVERFYAAE